MRTRIIIKNQKYVPQVKEHWWNFWAEICSGSTNRLLGIYQDFDTMEKAKKCIHEYQAQKKDDGKVVWEENLI